MRLADMHIHTTFSPDGKSSMEEQCIKAIEIGIPIICFTDHVDFNSSEINVGRIINKASTNFDVSEYFYEVNRLRRIYNSIQILIGIEFSEPHLFPTEFEDYSSMPFDYILGSIHHCYGSVFPGAKNIEESKAIDEYYNLMLKSIQTCEFQAMAHIDFPRRYFDNWNVSDIFVTKLKHRFMVLHTYCAPKCFGICVQKILDKYFSLCYNIKAMRIWRNWQTRMVRIAL